jgi:hypothetical protein
MNAIEKFKVAFSTQTDVQLVVRDIKEQLAGVDACLITFYCSHAYPLESINEEMHKAFEGARVVGCTSSAEMVTGYIGNGSLVAMAWHKDTLDYLDVQVLENIKTDQMAVDKAFKKIEKSLGEPIANLDSSEYVGILIVDGLSGCEEFINDKIGNLTNVPFVGGSAADELSFTGTYVFADGKIYTEAALVVLIKPTNGYYILKTQSFDFTGLEVLPTKVDEPNRTVLEFDGKPAAERFSEVVGRSLEELADSRILREYPVAMVYDEQNYFARVPFKTDEAGTVSYHCVIKENIELSIMKSGDIVEGTRKDLQQYIGKVQAIVDFNCAQRFYMLMYENKLDDYMNLFNDVTSIGFATYGENYIGFMNQTSVMLLLK